MNLKHLVLPEGKEMHKKRKEENENKKTKQSYKKKRMEGNILK